VYLDLEETLYGMKQYSHMNCSTEEAKIKFKAII
jgi:hypothetical protein